MNCLVYHLSLCQLIALPRLAFLQGLFNLLSTLKCCYNSIPRQPAAAFPKQHLETTLGPEEDNGVTVV